MSKIIYVTGGARSGKSMFAQQMAEKYTDVAYIATAEAGDSEMMERIALHQSSRPKSWTTYESPGSLKDIYAQKKHSFYIVDCLTVYISNRIVAEVEDPDAEIIDMDVQNAVEEEILQELTEIIETVRRLDLFALFVSNEVGMGLVPAYPMGRMFRDIVGRANKLVAAAADEAWLIVSGIPVKLK